MSNEITLNWPGGTIRLKRSNRIGALAQLASYSGDFEPDFIEALREGRLSAPQQLLDGMRYVPAPRGFTQARYDLGEAYVPEVTTEPNAAKRETQTATNLAYASAISDKVSEMLTRVTGMGVTGALVPSRSVEVRTWTPVGFVNILGEGFGTNSLVLLLFQVVMTPQHASVLIEEPEIHLHPKAQADLASLLAEVSQEEEKQLIMTTHSEHILGRFLTLVAEKKLSPEDLAIYAFEKDDEGVCTAKELKVTEDGRVEGGIPDFFEPNLQELDRYIKALATE